jgi:uncharacterized protein YbaR (Trm112 family)
MSVAGTASMPFLDLLACPLCGGGLVEERDGLVCNACARTFPLSDGVPDLLPSEPPVERAPGVVGRALSALVAMPRVYDAVQRVAGAVESQRRLRRALDHIDGAVVLDVGAGTGTLESILPIRAQYIWLDTDVEKLAGFRTHSTSPAILGDATRLPLADSSVDWAVSAGVSHHLDEEQLGRMLDEMRRVTREGIVFVDAVASKAPVNRLLWRYDRGRNVRSARELWRMLNSRFEIVVAEEYRLLHRYILVRGV